MVDAAARLTRTILLLAVAVAAETLAATEPGWGVAGTCREGRPQGPYQLRSADGLLRVAGAFNEGTRTGSFIFWAANGVRAAHVPYNDEGIRNGTVALWYDGQPGREPARRFESVWRHGRREGPTRSWYPDGRRRSETEYAAGRVATTVGWSQSGERLSDPDARALALRDETAADAIYARLDALIRDHPPRCN